MGKEGQPSQPQVVSPEQGQQQPTAEETSAASTQAAQPEQPAQEAGKFESSAPASHNDGRIENATDVEAIIRTRKACDFLASLSVADSIEMVRMEQAGRAVTKEQTNDLLAVLKAAKAAKAAPAKSEQPKPEAPKVSVEVPTIKKESTTTVLTEPAPRVELVDQPDAAVLAEVQSADALEVSTAVVEDGQETILEVPLEPRMTAMIPEQPVEVIEQTTASPSAQLEAAPEALPEPPAVLEKPKETSEASEETPAIVEYVDALQEMSQPDQSANGLLELEATVVEEVAPLEVESVPVTANEVYEQIQALGAEELTVDVAETSEADVSLRQELLDVLSETNTPATGEVITAAVNELATLIEEAQLAGGSNELPEVDSMTKEVVAKSIELLRLLGHEEPEKALVNYIKRHGIEEFLEVIQHIEQLADDNPETQPGLQTAVSAGRIAPSVTGAQTNMGGLLFRLLGVRHDYALASD